MRFAPAALACLLVLQVCGRAGASEPTESYSLRKLNAFRLANAESPEAEDRLGQLLREKRDDHEVLFRLGRLLFGRAIRLDQNSERKKLLTQARQYFIQAREAGSTEPLISTALAAINPDGSETHGPGSANPKLDQALQDAEAAYAKRDFEKAVGFYQQALALEPRHYVATLHLGDAYFASGRNDEAIRWFGKATELDPNRETAYRYRGDALMRQGKRDEAMEQYLQAVIASPYNAYPWRALRGYCQIILLKPWMPAEKVPVATVKPGKDKKTEINLPENPTAFQVAYAMARAKWQSENPDKTGPSYRQTIDEECAALRSLLAIFSEVKASLEPPPEALATALKETAPSLEQLKEIESAGLLEAHVFFFRSSQDIAADYPNYRNQNRDKLREYLVKFYLHL